MGNPETRHQKILELVEKNRQVTTGELMKILSTSRETVRRDLNELSGRGLLIKTHGGAISLENKAAFGYFTPLTNRRNAHAAEKLQLCRHAAGFVEEYDTIYIDNSTTTAHLIDFIPKYYKLTFLTNSIQLLTEFSMLHRSNWNVVSLGGVLDYETFSVGRHLAVSNLEHFQPNKAFISCHGIGEDFIVTDTTMEDVELKSYIVSACEQTYLLADPSKLPRRGVIKIADAVKFRCILTNNSVEPSFLSRLVEHDCTVQLVAPK